MLNLIKKVINMAKSKKINKTKLKKCTSLEELESYFDSKGLEADDRYSRIAHLYKLVNAVPKQDSYTEEEYTRQVNNFVTAMKQVNNLSEKMKNIKK